MRTIILILFLLFSYIIVFSSEDSLSCKKLNEEISKYQTYLNEKDIVQSSPEFVGEIDSLYALISNPPLPKNTVKPLSGKVVIEFIVDTSGNTHCFEVSKGFDPEYDKTALEYLKGLSLKFTPEVISYKDKYIKIPVIMGMPVIYKSKNEK